MKPVGPLRGLCLYTHSRLLNVQTVSLLKQTQRKSLAKVVGLNAPYLVSSLRQYNTSTAVVKSKGNVEQTRTSSTASAASTSVDETLSLTEEARRLLGIYSELSKAKLSMLVVASGTAGFLVAGAPVALDSLMAVTVGTGFCAAAANTFNQSYERHTDKLMKRTRRRPLPSGRISLPHALTFGFGCATAGTGILMAGCNPLAATLGFGNIILYSLVYTPMKQHSIANTWVGSVVGAIPPLMGYAAATGTIIDPEAILLGSGLFLWQFPHFFSLAWMIKKDYSAGGHHMVPCFDKTGATTANLLIRYSVALSSIPFASYALGITSILYPIESIAFNGYLLYTCKRFYENVNDENARKVFLTTLWNLPLFMFLMIFHKKEFLPKDKKLSECVVLSNGSNSH